MPACQLADLNGLLALEAAERARAGDARDKPDIVSDILREAGMPDLEPVIFRIGRLIAGRRPR